MTTRCQGLWGELFGHKFHDIFETRGFSASSEIVQSLTKTIQATYSTIYASDDENPFEEIIEALKTSNSTYVHSICPRCGEIIKREENN